MPLTVAYAITIHKAQGATYESVLLNVTGMFENGQLYTAMSRVKNLSKMQICGGLTGEQLANCVRPN